MPYELLVREAPMASQRLQAISVAVGCQPEPDRKTLLLKVTHFLVACHREIELEELGWKPHFWLDF